MRKIPFVNDTEKALYDNGRIALTDERLYYNDRMSSALKKLFYTRIIEVKDISSVGYGVVRNYAFLWLSIFFIVLGLGGTAWMSYYFINNSMTQLKLVIFLLSIAGCALLFMMFILLFIFKKEIKATVDYTYAHNKLSIHFRNEKDMHVFVRVLFKAMDKNNKPKQIRPNRLNLPF